MAAKEINLNLEELETIELPQIVKFIPMISPFKNEDKQVLLETKNLVEFYKKLISILELEIMGISRIKQSIDTHCKITN